MSKIDDNPQRYPDQDCNHVDVVRAAAGSVVMRSFDTFSGDKVILELSADQARDLANGLINAASIDDTPKHFTAEQTSHPDAKTDRWAIVYDRTPGGILNDDGSRTYSLRMPVLFLSDCVDDPEAAVKEMAAALNAGWVQDTPA